MFFGSSGLAPAKPPLTWQERLDTSHGEREIVAVARDFLAMFDPFELHALPEACRPPAKIVDADDIATYALELVRHGCGSEEPETSLQQRLTRFFLDAASRLSEVNGIGGRADADSRHPPESQAR